MFDTDNNAYNVDKKIDYSTIRSMIMRSLEKIVREELNRLVRRSHLNKMEEEEDVVLLLPTQIRPYPFNVSIIGKIPFRMHNFKEVSIFRLQYNIDAPLYGLLNTMAY